MSRKGEAAAGPLPVVHSPSPSRVEVVAAVITRPDGSFLLGQRPAGKVYAGYWEFPGGKIEAGEAPLAALRRELNEELGIEVRTAYPWLTRDYDYAHAAVRLHFFRVTGWSGTPQGRENQSFAWQLADAIHVDPLLPANGPILRALSLPPVYAITNAGELGEREFLARVERALAGGLKLLQVREKAMSGDALLRFASEVVRRAHASGARVLVNGDAALAQRAGADGVHLTSAQLRQLCARPRRFSSAHPVTTPGSSCAHRRWAAISRFWDRSSPRPVIPGRPAWVGMDSRRCCAIARCRSTRLAG